MEIKGTIIHAMPEVSGVSKAGNSWKKNMCSKTPKATFPAKWLSHASARMPTAFSSSQVTK